MLHTNAGALDPSATDLGLLIYAVVVVLLAAILAALQDDDRRTGRLALKTQAWQLRQLVGQLVVKWAGDRSRDRVTR